MSFLDQVLDDELENAGIDVMDDPTMHKRARGNLLRQSENNPGAARDLAAMTAPQVSEVSHPFQDLSDEDALGKYLELLEFFVPRVGRDVVVTAVEAELSLLKG